MQTIADSPRLWTNFYQGFIYKLCLSNFVSTDFNDVDPTPECTIGHCTTCPLGDCLIECAWDEYLVSGNCTQCDPLCD
jgi:hypothetical protein